MEPLEPSHAVTLALSNLLSVFNERDATKRKRAMAETYTPDMQVYEPDRRIIGHDEISAIVDKLLDEYPD